jgi:ferrochelatase
MGGLTGGAEPAVQARSRTVGVLVMAYGSPDRLEDMEAYLLDIRGGRPTSPELVAEIKARYERIGGRSPLLDITRAQAAALEAELNRRYAGTGLDFKAGVGMRHWAPRIPAAVDQFAGQGIAELVGLVMAPHSSQLSTGAYFAQLEAAVQALPAGFEVRMVPSWHDHPGLIAALAGRAEAALDRFTGTRPYVIFTAHSLPARILALGDPYEQQLRETAGLLAGRLGLAPGRWQFAYQSAGQSQEPWLGPAVEAVVAGLAEGGEKNLLVVPIGFVCDHVEVLYDIDIACRQLAAERGARLERSASLNTSPAFIAALAEIVARQVAVSA